MRTRLPPVLAAILFFAVVAAHAQNPKVAKIGVILQGVRGMPLSRVCVMDLKNLDLSKAQILYWKFEIPKAI